MMRGLVATLEKHHHVRILNEAVDSAVRLSSRYISGRQLPDKAVSLLDTTCGRIALSQTRHAAGDRRLPAAHRAAWTWPLGILRREAATGDRPRRTDRPNWNRGEAGWQRSQRGDGKELVPTIHELRAGQWNAASAASPDRSSERELRPPQPDRRESRRSRRSARRRPEKPTAIARQLQQPKRGHAAPGRSAADPRLRRRRRPSPRPSRPGPASPWAAWWPTKSRPC